MSKSISEMPIVGEINAVDGLSVTPVYGVSRRAQAEIKFDIFQAGADPDNGDISPPALYQL